jgi:hypothetical protein
MKRVKEIVLIVLIGIFSANSIDAMENPSTIKNIDSLRFLSDSIEDVYDAIFDFCIASDCQYELVTEPTTFKNYLKVLKLSFHHSNLIDIKYNYLQLKKRYKKNSEKSEELENAYENIMRILLDINDIGEMDKGAFHNCILHLSYMSLREVQTLVDKNELKNFFHLPKDSSDNDITAAYNKYMEKYELSMQLNKKKIDTLKAQLKMAPIPSEKYLGSKESKELINERNEIKQKLNKYLSEIDNLQKQIEPISKKYNSIFKKNAQ